MFKRKKEETTRIGIIDPETFRPIKTDPIRCATAQIGSLASFLTDEVENMEHNVFIETDSKIIEINVSVRSLVRNPDERESHDRTPAG